MGSDTDAGESGKLVMVAKEARGTALSQVSR
jgi:hypothetical protein